MNTSQIEQQLTVLLRRVQHIHLSTSTGEISLDRAAYGIMCWIRDHGPQRLGELASAFGLDPSTITRQVQSLEREGFVERTPDPQDRRAAVLSLSADGVAMLEETRARRREWLARILADWSEEERTELGRLLEKFNTTIDRLAAELSDTGA